MRFHADLHVHSRYSRATSKNADLEHMALWAAQKGIAVIGTGDFTHPAWRAELREKLVPAEPGLFRLRPELERALLQRLPGACAQPVRFMLEVEISTIYKKGDKTRKVHHLLYAPDFEGADRIALALARIGNIASDGRPILGLDSRDLLEITLASGPECYLVPAHIWTPWFAALGSRSGFDSIADCYGDLADQIFAVETGLSSDPEMNWRISALDRYRLVSNSDAHSPIKLGREATTFDCALDYFAIKGALATGAGYVGTVEFFPDEGKYHMDGHRKCGVCLSPEETRAHDGRCPVCGEPLTVGVLHRVNALADRSAAEVRPPATAGAVSSLVPLHEVLSEVVGSGPGSKRVARSYQHLVTSLGAELAILEQVPVEDIERSASSLLAEAITRLRAGRVIRQPGYDGEYGVIRLFEAAELEHRLAGGLLFDLGGAKPGRRAGPGTVPPPAGSNGGTAKVAPGPSAAALQLLVPTGDSQASLFAGQSLLDGLDEMQRLAAATVDGPLLIIAGPGAGKTRTLTHRIAHLIADHGVPPEACLAITFTRRAAQEMQERLTTLLGGAAAGLPIHTFHSLGLSILKAHAGLAGLPADFRLADEGEQLDLLRQLLDVSALKARSLLRAISFAKRTQRSAGEEVAAAIEVYQPALAQCQLVDFDDLIGMPLHLLRSRPELRAAYRERFARVAVDEFQDVDAQQYQLLQQLVAKDGHLCVIGDPNQAIYGFRGADAACFAHFLEDFPSSQAVRLNRNYRSSGTIVEAASQVIARTAETPPAAEVMRGLEEQITIHASPSERAEAEFVVQTIEQLLGGHSFFSIDSGRANGAAGDLSFADFAVLYRTDAQSAPLCEALARSGMPFKKHSHELLIDQPAVQALLGAIDDNAERSLRDELKAAAEWLALRDQQHDMAAVQNALQQLLALADSCSNSAERFVEALPLASEADCFDPRADRVSLLTLHAAKGLEFKVVFIVGLEDSILPLAWGRRNEAPCEEERRLFYVGMTRARDRLFLTRALKRQWRGKTGALQPSPYLDDIEAVLLRQSCIESPRRRPADSQLKLF